MDFTDRLILETNYRQEASAAQKELERLVAQQRELDESLRTGTLAQAAYDTLTARTTAELAAQGQAIEQAREGLAALAAQDRAATDAARDAARAAQELAAANRAVGDAATQAEAELRALEQAEAAAADRAVSAAVEQANAELHALETTERAAAEKAAKVQATLNAAGGGKSPLVDGLLGQTQAAQEVAELQAALGREVEALREVERAMQRGAATAEEYAHAEAAARAAAVDLAGAQKRFSESTGSFGRAAQQAGFALQDFTAGFQNNGLAGAIYAVNNNVTGLATSLGLGVGLAGTLQIAAVALDLFIRKWPQISQALGIGSEKASLFTKDLEALKKRVEELTKDEHKIAIDFATLDEAQHRLDKLTKDLAAFERLKGAATPVQEKVAKGVEEAVVEGGGAEKVRAGVTSALKAENQLYVGADIAPLNDQINQAQTDLEAERNRKTVGVVASQAQAARVKEGERKIAELLAKRDDLARKRVEDLIGGAATPGMDTEVNRKRLQDLYDAHPGLFAAAGVGAGFGIGIGNASKEHIELEQQGDLNAQQMADRAKLQAERDQKLNAQLAEQGAENEALARARAAAAATEAGRPELDTFETRPDRIRREAQERAQRKAKAQADAEQVRTKRREEQTQDEALLGQAAEAVGPVGAGLIARETLVEQGAPHTRAARAAIARNQARVRAEIARRAQEALVAQGVEPGKAEQIAGQVPNELGRQINLQLQMANRGATAQQKQLNMNGVLIGLVQQMAARQQQMEQQLANQERAARGLVRGNSRLPLTPR